MLTGNYESAADVVQEAFAEALRQRRAFRGDGTPEAWIWSIATRIALRERARDRREPVSRCRPSPSGTPAGAPRRRRRARSARVRPRPKPRRDRSRPDRGRCADRPRRAPLVAVDGACGPAPRVRLTATIRPDEPSESRAGEDHRRRARAPERDRRRARRARSRDRDRVASRGRLRGRRGHARRAQARARPPRGRAQGPSLAAAGASCARPAPSHTCWSKAPTSTVVRSTTTPFGAPAWR
jgi:DNA-directed RNA polymerase specialized sigma24 family protein